MSDNYPLGVSEADFIDEEPARVFIECGECDIRFTEDVDVDGPCPECGRRELVRIEEYETDTGPDRLEED